MTKALSGVVNLALWTAQRAVELGKSISPWMAKQVLKKACFTWRRVPKSCQSQRDTTMFEFFKTEVAELQAEAAKGLIRLWFYDESGFNLNPNALYAWQPSRAEQRRSGDRTLPAQRGNVLTLAAFLASDNTLEAYSHTGAMDSHAFIAFVEDFIEQQLKPSTLPNIVLLDNASFHKSALVRQKMAQWKKQNLFFQFLPPYCSELNRIEILWRRIKHEWLEIEDFQSAHRLHNAVTNIILLFGTKYSITFC